MKKRKTYFIVILILLLVTSILSIIYFNKKDTSAINQLLTIVNNDEERSLTKEELDDYETRVTEEVIKAKNAKVKKQGYYCLGLINYLNSDFNIAIDYFEKAIKITEKDSVDSYKEDIMIYGALSGVDIILNKTNKANMYFNRAKEIAIANNMYEQLSYLYYGKAKAMLISEASVEEVIKVIEESTNYTNDSRIMIRNYLFLAAMYKVKGDLNLSLINTGKALDVALDSKDKALIDKCIIRLGENYFLKENYLKAIIIYEDLLNVKDEIEKEDLLVVYRYLSYSYAKLNKYDKYKKYTDLYMKVLEHLEGNIKTMELAWLYIISACVELDFSNIEEAKLNLSKFEALQGQGIHDIGYGIDLWTEYVRVYIDYLENHDYNKVLTDFENLIEKNDNRGMRTNSTILIIENIIKISFENQDYETMIKYLQAKVKFHKNNTTLVYTDIALQKVDDYIQRQTMLKERAKVCVLSIIIIIMVYNFFIINRNKKEIIKLNKELEEKNKVDYLTKVYNKRYLNEVLVDVYKSQMKITLVIIDIDYFKLYNDNYGHVKGDEILSDVAKVIKNVFKEDLVFRYGGEEFLILITKDLNESLMLIDKLQNGIYNENIEHKHSQVSDRITLSIGVASGKVSTEIEFVELIKTADSNLYKAKEQGRNRYIY